MHVQGLDIFEIKLVAEDKLVEFFVICSNVSTFKPFYIQHWQELQVYCVGPGDTQYHQIL